MLSPPKNVKRLIRPGTLTPTWRGHYSMLSPPNVKRLIHARTLTPTWRVQAAKGEQGGRKAPGNRSTDTSTGRSQKLRCRAGVTTS